MSTRSPYYYNGTSILPIINISLLQGHDKVLPNEDPNKFPHGDKLKGLNEFLFKDSTIDEILTQKRFLNKLLWVNGYFLERGEHLNPWIE